MNRYDCPCCGYPTLDERGGYDICCLCNWEDDGQDDPNADEVWGGPNSDYSLTEARENFKKHYIMYREKRSIVSQTEKGVATKKSLIKTFEKLKTVSNGLYQQVWQEVDVLEEILHDIVRERANWFSDNVEKYQSIIKLVNSDKPDVKAKGLLSLALNAEDGAFAQHLMLNYSQHENENIRGTAILCFGHIARIHGTIDQELVVPLLNEGLNDDSKLIRSHSQSALDDVNTFCK